MPNTRSIPTRFARSTTHCTSGLPAVSTRHLPGNRVEAYRAGMMLMALITKLRPFHIYARSRNLKALTTLVEEQLLSVSS